MMAITDNKRRVVLPKPIQTGDIFDVEPVDSHRILLTRLEKPPVKKARLQQKHGYLMIVTDRKITTEETLKAIKEVE